MFLNIFLYLVEVTLAEENKLLKEQIAALKHELEQLKKLIFGHKSERFVGSVDAQQGSLFEDTQIAAPVEAAEETTTVTTTKKVRKKHPGRNPIPKHLPVREVIIEPVEDTTGMEKIGEDQTEMLEYTPASLVRKIIIRPKYKDKVNKKIIVAPLPDRPINRCYAEASLLAFLMVAKFVDHLPFYRQIQIFKRDYDWIVNKSTINDWFIACCTLLEPLYQHMVKTIKEAGYLLVDESPIQVQDNNSKTKKTRGTHRGYQWVYCCALTKTIIFDYRKGRGMQGPKEMLAGYQGWIQCDGYSVYDKLGKSPNIQLVGCWAHNRRKYSEAQNNDAVRATQALTMIQQIYDHERICKDMSIKERYDYRQEHLAPLLSKFKLWADTECVKVLPKSAIGKAITYTQNQWAKLKAILQDGRLRIDNNLVENKIRPLALGRKNYLFAGSHEAAQRIAMMYSFFATCKANEINPYDWMKDTLEKIKETKLSQLHTLVPGYVAEK